MILKRGNNYYNFIGIETDFILDITLCLEYWYKYKNKFGYGHAKRKFTVHSWNDMINLMGSFEEVSSGVLNASTARQYINNVDKSRN